MPLGLTVRYEIRGPGPEFAGGVAVGHTRVERPGGSPVQRVRVGSHLTGEVQGLMVKPSQREDR